MKYKMVYELHAVIISRNIPLNDAKNIASKFIPSTRRYYRTTTNSYRFRNIPKTKFDKNSFRSKVINDDITLVYGNI
jgi:hypothetical protein